MWLSYGLVGCMNSAVGFFGTTADSIVLWVNLAVVLFCKLWFSMMYEFREHPPKLGVSFRGCRNQKNPSWLAAICSENRKPGTKCCSENTTQHLCSISSANGATLCQCLIKPNNAAALLFLTEAKQHHQHTGLIFKAHWSINRHADY